MAQKQAKRWLDYCTQSKPRSQTLRTARLTPGLSGFISTMANPPESWEGLARRLLHVIENQLLINQSVLTPSQNETGQHAAVLTRANIG